MRHLVWLGTGALVASALLACPGEEEVHEQAWLRVNRDPWIMDAVYLGASRQDSMYIENWGLTNLELTSVDLAGSSAFSKFRPADNSPNPTTMVIEPKKRSYLTLIFNPSQAGTYTGQITINSNATNTPVRVIDVSSRAEVYDGGM